MSGQDIGTLLFQFDSAVKGQQHFIGHQGNLLPGVAFNQGQIDLLYGFHFFADHENMRRNDTQWKLVTNRSGQLNRLDDEFVGPGHLHRHAHSQYRNHQNNHFSLHDLAPFRRSPMKKR